MSKYFVAIHSPGETSIALLSSDDERFEPFTAIGFDSEDDADAAAQGNFAAIQMGYTIIEIDY